MDLSCRGARRLGISPMTPSILQPPDRTVLFLKKVLHDPRKAIAPEVVFILPGEQGAFDRICCSHGRRLLSQVLFIINCRSHLWLRLQISLFHSSLLGLREHKLEQ